MEIKATGGKEGEAKSKPTFVQVQLLQQEPQYLFKYFFNFQNFSEFCLKKGRSLVPRFLLFPIMLGTIKKDIKIEGIKGSTLSVHTS